jgi:meso-butanediol dehydrogenase/(S,S)-butanediol dehydrogenase/diacetyl reductase
MYSVNAFSLRQCCRHYHHKYPDHPGAPRPGDHRSADRAYVLENGRVCLQGACDEFLESDYERQAYLGLQPKSELEMKLDGKIALITGAGTGIGAAIAARFVADGARICITGRRQHMLDKVAQSLPEGTVVTCAGDVTKFENAEQMVETALGFTGKLDVLVNNAAIDRGGTTVVDIDPEVWHEVLEINLTGPMHLMKASIPHMIENGGGSIINIASLGGLRCLPGMPAYCASKAGLIMLTKQVALDFGPDKIRCNVVCPGGTRTEMLETSLSPLTEALGTDLDGVFAHISSLVPLRRTASPSEITGICSYLASDDSTFMTGSVLLVDGGAAIVDVAGAMLTTANVKWGV